jgi:Tol biopolymer transport system component
MDILYANIPPWVSEGLAEYYTENWRPFRFDISHKGHVYKNTLHKIKDPHNDGFSKSLYLADRFGDSTITKILNHRNKFGLLNFGNSFKKHTGISLKQFNEDWRLLMNTYYFGNRSQKESILDIGSEENVPGSKVQFFDYSSDTLQMAVIGKMSKGQIDNSIILATRDTTKENKIYRKRLKKQEKDKKQRAKKPKTIWKLKELDSGRFGELIQNLDIAPNNKTIVYPKYHFGKNQSLVIDICKYELETDKITFLTNSMRANYPKFSPDGKEILFVAHENSNSQLFLMKNDGSNIKKLTNFSGDIQIITPSWSPNGDLISFSKSNSDGWMDIYILDLRLKEITRVTNSKEADFNPIWVDHGNKISFTSMYELTPNIFTYNINTKELIQNTDIGDIAWAIQYNEKKKALSAMTISTSSNSKIVSVDPKRVARKRKPQINEKFSSWIEKRPEEKIGEINYDKPIKIVSKSNYSFKKNLRHLGTIIIPDFGSVLYNSVYSDVLGRHTFSTLLASDYDKHTSIFFQYQNATGILLRSFWGVDYYRNANFNFQLYNNKETILEVFNGFSIWVKSPYNFGRSISKNHFLTYSIQIIDRIIQIEPKNESNSKSLDVPQPGKEGSFNLGYTFVSKRPHARNLYNPNHGYGFSASVKKTIQPIFGIFDYTKFKLDFYFNKKIGPFSLFSRSRFESTTGLPPNQEKLGIFDLPNFYIMGSSTPGREYMSPRGFKKPARLGEMAYLGTLEFRAPILPINIIDIFKFINFGKPTVAIISDFGDAWSHGNKREEFIVQAGAEFRFSMTLYNLPLFTFSYGWAQSIKEWNNGVDPSSYFQLTLINPF